MSRKRLTWTKEAAQGKQASPPPQMPAVDRTEGPDHPAYYPDPEKDKYEKGDTSSWAEDPHVPTDPESPPPAMPGNLTTEPLDHPATSDFQKRPESPAAASATGGGAGKAAAQQPAAPQATLKELAERRASLCVHIANATMKGATVQQIEDKALQLMDLDDTQLQATAATLNLVAGEEMEEETETEIEETEDREAAKKANVEVTARLDRLEQSMGRLIKAMGHFFGMDEEEEKKAGEDMSDEELMAYLMAEDQDGDGIDQSKNDFPQGYDVDKMSQGGEDEEAMLRAMLEEMDDKTASEAEEVTDPLAKGPSIQSGEGGNVDPSPAPETPQVEGAQTGGTAVKAAEETNPADNDIEINAGADPMGLMETDKEAGSDNELMALYADLDLPGKTAGEEEEGEEVVEEMVEGEGDEEKEAAAKKKAASEPKLRPQPKTASKGPKTLGNVPQARTASGEIAELQKLWETAPDVSQYFGVPSSSGA